MSTTTTPGATILGVPADAFRAFMAQQGMDGHTPTLELQVKLLSEYATVPYRATDGSAGYDLCAALAPGTTEVIAPGAKKLIGTGISAAIPKGHYGRIAARSGLAAKGANVLGGVIDTDYRGEIKVILINHTYDDFTFHPGDRIAQLILERCSTPPVRVVEALDATARGAGGFGSTGMKSDSPSERGPEPSGPIEAV